MSEVMIDGWRCTSSEAARVAQHCDGTAFVYDIKLGLTGTVIQLNVATPAVLSWLIAPIVDAAVQRERETIDLARLAEALKQIADHAHDLDDDSHEKRSERLGECCQMAFYALHPEMKRRASSGSSE